MSDVLKMPLPLCWKCHGTFTPQMQGTMRNVQRVWDNDLIPSPITGEPIAREDQNAPYVCALHGPTIVLEDRCPLLYCTLKGPHCSVPHCQTPEPTHGTSVPHWIYANQEQRLPDGWEGHTMHGKWVAFHDECGAPGNPSEAWSSSAWHDDEERSDLGLHEGS